MSQPSRAMRLAWCLVAPIAMLGCVWIVPSCVEAAGVPLDPRIVMASLSLGAFIGAAIVAHHGVRGVLAPLIAAGVTSVVVMVLAEVDRGALWHASPHVALCAIAI